MGDAGAPPVVATYRNGPKYLIGESPHLLAVHRGSYVSRHLPRDFRALLVFRRDEVVVVDGVLHHRGRPCRSGETVMLAAFGSSEEFTGLRLPAGWTLDDHLLMVL